MGIILNEGQEKAAADLAKWINCPYSNMFKISGGPGTGKTTMLKSALSRTSLKENEITYCAFTGKVVNRMREAGLNSQTIHSTIYMMEKEYMRNGDGSIKIGKNGAPIFKNRRIKRDYLPDNIKLIVVDEAPMVADEYMTDLLSYGIPLVAVGDINQLPAPFGSCTFFRHPNVHLTQIMRQAEGSPIIYLAEMAKRGQYIKPGWYGKTCYVGDTTMVKMNNSLLAKAGVVIVSSNKSRDYVNQFIRKKVLGRKDDTPVIGDKMICRRNNWNIVAEGYPLTNGSTGVIDYIDRSTFNGKKLSLDFHADYLNGCYYNLDIDINYLHSTWEEKKDIGLYTNGNLMDYAYALTCQLAQGSEYNSVFIRDEHNGGNESYHRKWLYTAITRAKKGLIICNNFHRPKKYFTIFKSKVA